MSTTTDNKPAYSPGLAGVVAGETSICWVDPNAGLMYRGYDIGPDYLVMEYIAGRTFRSLTDRPQPVDLVARLGKQIAEGGRMIDGAAGKVEALEASAAGGLRID